MTESETITYLVSRPRTVAVVGLSPKPHRESFKVAAYLQRHGWRIAVSYTHLTLPTNREV